MVRFHSPITSHHSLVRLDIRLGLRKAENFCAFLKLAALLQKLDALETLQDVPFRRDGAGSFETAMLRHKKMVQFSLELRAGRLQRDLRFSTGRFAIVGRL